MVVQPVRLRKRRKKEKENRRRAYIFFITVNFFCLRFLMRMKDVAVLKGRKDGLTGHGINNLRN